MERTIIEYKVLSERNKLSLNEAVNNLISEGWEPYHGPAVCESDNTSPTYAQAVVKYAPSII